MQQPDQQYQKLLTEVIKKQIIILGPSITLAKARNVRGLTVSEDGTVTAISGNPQELTRELIDQFMELSSLIVKETIEPVLANHPGLIQSIQSNPTMIQPDQITSSQIKTPPNHPAPPPAPLQNSTSANQEPANSNQN